MHVMRLHIADRKLWSANDRRTGGKAVPIKEHCSDTAYPWYVDPEKSDRRLLLMGTVGRLIW